MTSTELGYLSGVTSNIQTQLDGKVRIIKYQRSNIDSKGWKQLFSWSNTMCSFLVTITNNYNYNRTDTVTFSVTTGYDAAKVRLINTSRSVQSLFIAAGVSRVESTFYFNIYYNGATNNLYYNIIPLDPNIDIVEAYSDSAYTSSSYMSHYIGLYAGTYCNSSAYGDTLPEYGYAGDVFFLKST